VDDPKVPAGKGRIDAPDARIAAARRSKTEREIAVLKRISTASVRGKIPRSRCSYERWLIRPSLGPQWRDNFDRRISVVTSGMVSVATSYRANGNCYHFTLTDGQWTSDADVAITLVSTADSSGEITGWALRDTNGTTELYDANGYLTKIIYRDQRTLTLSYGGSYGSSTYGTLLGKVTDERGRELIFKYAPIRFGSTSAMRMVEIDAPGGSARVVQAIPVHLDDGGRAQMVLVDAGQHLLHLCDETGVYASVEGPYQKVKRARTIDLDGDGFDEILLLGERSLLVIRPTQLEWTATEVFTRRHEEENGRSTALALGDLNDDGITDLIVVDGVRSELEIFAGGNNLFSSALRFPVFEKKLFRGGGRAIEPRRVMVRDFDGDGLQDVAILVHDRLIIYPQDSTGGVR